MEDWLLVKIIDGTFTSPIGKVFAFLWGMSTFVAVFIGFKWITKSYPEHDLPEDDTGGYQKEVFSTERGHFNAGDKAIKPWEKRIVYAGIAYLLFSILTDCQYQTPQLIDLGDNAIKPWFM